MYCEDYKKLMIEFFDTGLTDLDKTLLDKHLEVCKSCTTEFEELKNLFVSLEKENQILLNESERYIQAIDVEDIISKRKKTNWFEFQFKPSFAFAVMLLIAFVVYFNLSSVKSISNREIVRQENLNETNSTDFLSSYINQDYIYENIDLTTLPQSDYFKDVVNFLDQLGYLFLSNDNLINDSYPALNNLDEKEMDEIIAQLENKKFLGE
ncbi:MAG: zf-HC2 domain-containing protein [Ignavibacteria bacterium]